MQGRGGQGLAHPGATGIQIGAGGLGWEATGSGSTANAALTLLRLSGRRSNGLLSLWARLPSVGGRGLWHSSARTGGTRRAEAEAAAETSDTKFTKARGMFPPPKWGLPGGEEGGSHIRRAHSEDGELPAPSDWGSD